MPRDPQISTPMIRSRDFIELLGSIVVVESGRAKTPVRNTEDWTGAIQQHMFCGDLLSRCTYHSFLCLEIFMIFAWKHPRKIQISHKVS